MPTQAPVKKPQSAGKGQRPGTRPGQRPKQQQKRQPQGAKQQPRRRGLSAREKRGAQMLLAILFVAAVIYVVAVLIIAFFIWYSFGTLSETTTLYALRVYGDGGETRIASYSVEEVNNRYGLYVPYSVLAPLCGFGVAGDSDQVTLYLPDAAGDTGSIRCIRDSSLVEINGTSVRLSSPVLFEGEDYLLPVSLFESCLSGLEIAYDDEKQLCTLTVPEKPAFSLKLHRPEPAEPCTPEQLSFADRNTGMNSTGDSDAESSDAPDEPEE